ncbi:MAG: hypothetical protein PHD95_06130 [Candidatus ainarchaeum sp.]|nr:hypothetical protein [Candidatus ainarchaeum sp.]
MAGIPKPIDRRISKRQRRVSPGTSFRVNTRMRSDRRSSEVRRSQIPRRIAALSYAQERRQGKGRRSTDA